MDSAGRPLLRLAAAEEPANYRKNGIERLAAGFGEMHEAPRRKQSRSKARATAQS